MANLLQSIGNAQPVSQFIDTALKYQTVQSNMETHRMQQQLLQQQVLQSEKDNKLYDPNAVLSLYDEHTRPHIMEAWKQSGVLDPGTGQIRGADVRNTPQLIVQNQKVSEALMTAEYERLAKKNATLAKKTDAASQQEALDNVAQMTAIEKARRLGKEKETTLVPKGTKGTMSGGVYTPLPTGNEDIQNVDLGTPLGTAESGAEIYHTTLGNVAVDPDTQQRTIYNQQEQGSYSKNDETPPTTIREFESVYPEMAGKAGIKEYTKGYEKFLELKGNRINAVTYLGQNEQGDFIVGKTRGVGAGAPPQVVPNPAGGQLKPNVVRPLGSQEQEKFVGASNIAHVLPDMIPFRDLVRAKGGPIIDQVRGKAAEKMIDAGLGSQTGLPPEAIKAHVAVTHLKTWATGMLKGAGSDVQRAQLIATLPTLYDSADVIDQKMRKTINIVRRIATNTIQSAAAGGKAVPPDMYRQLADMEDFANQLGSGEIPTDLPKGTVDLGNGMYKLPNGKTVRKQ